MGKIYKGKDGSWFVPAFDKKTGKFLGANWVGPEGGYFGGVDSHAEFKSIVSTKSSVRSEINEDNQEHDFKGIIKDSEHLIFIF